MAVAAMLFVSKRLTLVAAALLCLMAGRLLADVSSASAASPTEVRVAITR
ncbi:hypothetical protein [Caulobacter sp. S45]|jgi:hypothetical protein|nr:hypothetical protein [Caulobacter sp. S45]